jgi:hypothetical protein
MVSDPFYVDYSPVLNQGDIVDHVPWGLIEAPTTLCRPSNRSKTSGKAFYGSVAELKNPAPWTCDPELVHGISWDGLAMVLWHGCQLDKWKNRDEEMDDDKNRQERAFAGIAPVLRLADYEPAKGRADIASRKHYAFFPLPPFKLGTRQIPESYVDFRHIWSVRQSILTNRLASISQQARLSLYEHLFTFFTRFRLDLNASGTSVTLTLVPEPGE